MVEIVLGHVIRVLDRFWKPLPDGRGSLTVTPMSQGFTEARPSGSGFCRLQIPKTVKRPRTTTAGSG